jgi:transcriptional regulator with XRE-family HTH domain
MSFNIRLRELRKVKGLTESALCAELGVARSTYSDWENGRKKPAMDMLIKMANYHQVSLDDLVDRYNQAVDQSDDPWAVLSYEGRCAV